jgi:hypothetical protein
VELRVGDEPGVRWMGEATHEVDLEREMPNVRNSDGARGRRRVCSVMVECEVTVRVEGLEEWDVAVDEMDMIEGRRSAMVTTSLGMLLRCR